MSGFQPLIDDPVWAEVKSFVSHCVGRCSGRTPYSDQDLNIAATKLCAWAWETAGFELDIGLVFRRDVIGNYIASGAGEYKPAGRGNLRSQLLRMAEVLLPESTQRRLPPLPASDPTRPYRRTEIQSLRAWADWQSTPARQANARTLLALGLGAGLSAIEIGTLRIQHIHVDRLGVIVHVQGERPRTVPVLREWEPDLVARSRQLPEDKWAFRENHTAFYPNLISNFVNRSKATVVRPQAQRMRTTWLLTHLKAGTPLPSLLAAAGIESLSALNRYLQFLQPEQAVDVRLRLRNAGSRQSNVSTRAN